MDAEKFPGTSKGCAEKAVWKNECGKQALQTRDVLSRKHSAQLFEIFI